MNTNQRTLNNRSRLPFVRDGVVWIPLQRKRFAFCDIEDFDLVRRHIWCTNNRGYVCSRVYPNGSYGGIVNLRLHRLIHPEWSTADHIDRDKLNNRRSNLRQATLRQNSANRTKQVRHAQGSTSEFKGVVWSRLGKCWVASISHANRTMMCLGRFNSEMDAAIAYDRAALEIYGEFACTNFPSEVIQAHVITPRVFKSYARPKKPGTSSKYIGVCWHKAQGKWAACITLPRLNGKRRRRTIGYFNDELTAARAYDAAAWGMRRDKVGLNFPGAVGREY